MVVLKTFDIVRQAPLHPDRSIPTASYYSSKQQQQLRHGFRISLLCVQVRLHNETTEYGVCVAGDTADVNGDPRVDLGKYVYTILLVWFYEEQVLGTDMAHVSLL